MGDKKSKKDKAKKGRQADAKHAKAVMQKQHMQHSVAAGSGFGNVAGKPAR